MPLGGTQFGVIVIDCNENEEDEDSGTTKDFWSVAGKRGKKASCAAAETTDGWSAAAAVRDEWVKELW